MVWVIWYLNYRGLKMKLYQLYLFISHVISMILYLFFHVPHICIQVMPFCWGGGGFWRMNLDLWHTWKTQLYGITVPRFGETCGCYPQAKYSWRVQPLCVRFQTPGCHFKLLMMMMMMMMIMMIMMIMMMMMMTMMTMILSETRGPLCCFQ